MKQHCNFCGRKTLIYPPMIAKCSACLHLYFTPKEKKHSKNEYSIENLDKWR